MGTDWDKICYDMYMYGGGGISGLKSLEGTFISNCILNARMAARSIGNLPLTP